MITGWWASDDEERYMIGPCPTRQAAIDEALRAGIYQEFEPEPPETELKAAIYVCEADSPDPTDVVVDGARFLEDLENGQCEEWLGEDGGPMLDETLEQRRDLGDRLTAAFREWVTHHGLALRYSAFTATRHEERVVLAHPDAQP